jgi:hypothetical protein
MSVAKLAHRQMREIPKRRFIQIVDNQTRDFIRLIPDSQMPPEFFERQIGQRHLRRHALFSGTRCHASQFIARPCRRRASYRHLQIVEPVRNRADTARITHTP